MDCFVMDELFEDRWIIIMEWITLLGLVSWHRIGDGLMDRALLFEFVYLGHARGSLTRLCLCVCSFVLGIDIHSVEETSYGLITYCWG